MNTQRYIRIVSLNNNDIPQDSIEGRVTQGSINIDGASKLRRTCNLTFDVFGDNYFIKDENWSFNTKFLLEIGDKQDNNEIQWFKQGIFIITSFSKSESTNAVTISISGQDKMCRLNGTVSGTLFADHDFGTIEEIDENGVSTITKLPIQTIIYQGIQTYGRERPENIVINDLDINSFELWEYRGVEPIYYIISKQTNDIITAFFDKDNVEKLNIYNSEQTTVDINTFKFYSYNKIDPNINDNADTVNYQDTESYIAKIESGQAAGYHAVPLVYNSDLTLSIGNSFTDLLDKIVQMLGPYEYFYDIDGKFIFQRKKTYIQELFSPIDGNIINPTMAISPYSYEITDDKLNTQKSFSPKIDNVKNDFVVWGKKDSGAKFHGRVAIDKKPTYYKTMEYYKPFEAFYLSVTEITSWNPEKGVVPYRKTKGSSDLYSFTIVAFEERDWENKGDDEKWYSISRQSQWIEDICFKNDNHHDRSVFTAIKNGYKEIMPSAGYYYKNENEEYIQISSKHKTGTLYSLIGNQEYNNIEYDWREIIYQMAVDFYRHGQKDNFYLELEANNKDDNLNLNRYPNGITGYEQYYADMQGFWRLLYDPNGDSENYYTSQDGNNKYWNRAIHTDPSMLLFWFEFLDTDGELGAYSAKNIGQRIKVENSEVIKSIYFREWPEVEYIVSPEIFVEKPNSAYRPVWIPKAMSNLFIRSTENISLIDKINDLMYTHSACSESLNITCVPMWDLQPNTRVKVGNTDYTLDKISCSLGYDGMMSLTLTKILTNFY